MPIKYWTIGLFIILGVGLFTTILFLIGNRQKTFGSHLVVYAEFANLSELPLGAKVSVAGLDAGEVKKIEIPSTPSGKFRLELQLESKIRGLVRSDSVASIQTQGLVGDQLLVINKGTDGAAEAKDGSTLRSKEPIDLSSLIAGGADLLKDVHGDVNDIDKRADMALESITKTVNHTDGIIVAARPDLNRILNNGSAISATVNTLVADVNAGKGTVGMLLSDDPTRQQVQASLTNIQHASTNLDQAMVKANATMADFQARNLPAKAAASLDNVQALSLQLNTAVQQALAQDDIGQDGATNLRETLSGLNRSTTNLAEDTEALKHNFFLRGFFKKRGFYSLDEVTPAEYMKACERQKHAGPRLWLQAATFVVGGADGREQLTAAGDEQIDAAVDPYVGSLPGQIIMVEGYATDGTQDQQFIVARRRADLVRKYLEEHFHLKHDDLGVVALRSTPPQGAGRGSWNGAAISLMTGIGASAAAPE
jgi:phospholipid/cholesterol/gamma-HCH transport system substrate-binding protein